MALLGLIGGLAGIGGSILSGWNTNQTNLEINQKNREHEMNMLGLQQQFAAQQAQLADQRTRMLYNDLQSPEAIRNQLEKAGLSVGMMYGTGGMGGQMSSGAQAQSPAAMNMGTIPMQNPFGIEGAIAMANLEKMWAETDNIKADTENKGADTDKKQQEINAIQQSIRESQQKIIESQQKVDNMVAEKMKIYEETQNYKALSELYKAQKIYNESLTELNNIDSWTRTDLNIEKINELKGKIKEYEASAKKLGAETSVINGTKQFVIDKIMWESNQAKKIFEELMPEQIKEVKALAEKYTQEGKATEYKNMNEKERREMLKNMGLNSGTAKLVEAFLGIITKILD